MAVPPIVQATLQSSVLAAVANLLAQALTAFREEDKLVVDWIPVFQFVLYSVLSTPPNFMWQDFIESTFPATKKVVPTTEAVTGASAKDEKALDRTAKAGQLVEPVPKLNMKNTIIKLILDQTIGSAVNTLMFSVFFHSVQMAMAHRPHGAEHSMMFLMRSFARSGKDDRPALDFTAVRWDEVMPKAKAEFMPLLSAGWRLWPLVSLINFAFVQTVEMRNLVGGLAGIAWGIYVSLFTAGN